MNFLEIAALTAAVVNFALALFVFRQDTKAPLHRAYFVWGIGVVLWNVSCFWMYRDVSPGTALIFAKVLQFGIIIAPVGLFTASVFIAQRNIPKFGLGAICILHAFFAGSLWSDWFVRGVRRIQISSSDLGYWSIPGPVFWVYAVSYTALIAGSIYVLYTAQRKAQSLQKIRIRAMLVAIAFICPAGTNDLLPIFIQGPSPKYPFTNIPFYPLGNIAACIYMTIVAYSVLQHTLLDVHVTLSRIAAHLVRITFVVLTGLCLLLIAAAIAPGPFNGFWFATALGTVFGCAVVASVFFPRIFGPGGSDTFERRVLGDNFEYQDKVRSFINYMAWYGDLDALLNDVHEVFLRAFRLGSYRIILRDESNRVFTLFRAWPEEPQRQLPELKPQSPVLRYFDWGKGEYLSLSRTQLRMAAGSVEREASEQLKEFGAEFCFPLSSQSEPFGLLLVGRKTSGEPFTATDINLFVSLVKSMSLMVNQIRLKTQIMQAQELDLLGRMSRGMAHDLNNLLTPIWTLLQLSSEAGNMQPFDDELLPVALRNINTMRAYIKEALFFSENLRPDFQFGRLDLAVHHAVELARASRKKEMEIVTTAPGEILVEMDEVLVQRLVANLISNAIDASQPKSRINVTIERLPHPDAGRDWLRIRVIDYGEGIPKENLGRILKPYFTTKNRGDENRGFGLGLAITQKIVNLHGGNLSIASQLKKGTTVQIDLPSRQEQKVAPPISVTA
jgi:signal transduction histidine kinase